MNGNLHVFTCLGFWDLGFGDLGFGVLGENKA